MADHSNFITPPDVISPEDRTVVLLVDVDWVDVDTVAAYCKLIQNSYDVYLYSSDMDNLSWLEQIFSVAKAVVVNTEPSPLSPIKDKWTENEKCYHYGPKTFLKSQQRRIKKPAEFFVNKDK